MTTQPNPALALADEAARHADLCANIEPELYPHVIALATAVRELVAQLESAVPLERVAEMVEAAYAEGHRDGQRYMGDNYRPHAISGDYQASEARAAVERLRAKP